MNEDKELELLNMGMILGSIHLMMG